MKSKIKKKNTTLDDLALMVAEGFNDMRQKMASKEELKKEMAEVNLRIDGLTNAVNNYLRL